VVLTVKAGVVKLLPVAMAVPPVAAVYQLIIVFGSLLVAVIVVVLPAHTDVPVVPATGAAGVGDTVTFTAVLAAEGQPPLLIASI
jgi:hypothetical protein